ncbi:MAG: ACT domain-containing protein [Actinomycetota bacterium]
MSEGNGPETDLGVMLRSLRATRRPGVWTYVTVNDPLDALELLRHAEGVDAIIREDEGITVVIESDVAGRIGTFGTFRAAWLTLDVNSALEAVGLTAAVSQALAEVDIPCNVIAAHHHDHLLVPLDRVDDALDAIAGLRSAAGA